MIDGWGLLPNYQLTDIITEINSDISILAIARIPISSQKSINSSTNPINHQLNTLFSFAFYNPQFPIQFNPPPTSIPYLIYPIWLGQQLNDSPHWMKTGRASTIAWPPLNAATQTIDRVNLLSPLSITFGLLLPTGHPHKLKSTIWFISSQMTFYDIFGRESI